VPVVQKSEVSQAPTARQSHPIKVDQSESRWFKPRGNVGNVPPLRVHWRLWLSPSRPEAWNLVLGAFSPLRVHSRSFAVVNRAPNRRPGILAPRADLSAIDAWRLMPVSPLPQRQRRRVPKRRLFSWPTV